MIIRTDPQHIRDYFEDSSSLSQSRIKLILKGMDIFNKDEKDEKKLYYEEKGHLIYGNAVDSIITQGNEIYEQEFAVMLADKPGPKFMSTLHKIFDRFIIDKDIDTIRKSTLLLNITDQEIQDAAISEDYQSNWTKSKLLSNVKEKGRDYFDSLCMHYGKQLISSEEFITISSIIKSLEGNPLTSWLFETDINKTPEEKKIFFQVPIYFIFHEIQCKALLDMIVIDTKEKTITPYDLKTLGDYTINFGISVMRNRYDIQAAFYTEAIKEALRNSLAIFDSYDCSTYELKPFRFVVESTVKAGNPLIYECSQELLEIGLHGREGGYSHLYNYEQNSEVPHTDVYHQPLKGVLQGLELYSWHEENGYETDRLVSENNGILNLDWNKIS